MSFIAEERGTPARSRFRTALRRRSWTRRLGTPASRQQRRHTSRWSPSCLPSRQNTHGTMTLCSSSQTSVRSRCRFNSATSDGKTPNGKRRPSRFFVVPGSRRTTPALKSTCAQVSDFASPMRQPVRHANSITGANQTGSRSSTRRTSSSVKNPLRTLSSLMVGSGGRTASFPATTPSLSIRPKAATS
jgi:hypothetical protein